VVRGLGRRGSTLAIKSLHVLGCVALVVSAQARAQANAVEVLEQRRDLPPSVPSDYVLTPFGYTHPSCIQEVPEDEWVRGKLIVAKDGTSREIGRCLFPSFDPRGREVMPASAQISSQGPSASGYLADLEDQHSPAVDYLSATWIVPSAPPKNTGQTVYFFPGISPLVGGIIIQPVLAWNGPDASPGWSIYSWYYDNNNSLHRLHSPAVPVTAGETISGYAAGTNCNLSTRLCSTWQIRTAATSVSSTLTTDPYGAVFDRPFAGALEVTSINTCAQLPPSGHMTFNNLSVHQLGGGNLSPAWQSFITTADCGIATSVSGSSVTISWCVPATSCGSRVCGTMPDGCGGTLSCGTCSGSGKKCFSSDGTWYYSGQSCSASGTCVSNPCLL
jgi:hypothetical protein